MQLDWIEIGAFRSYEAVRFDPEPGVNILLGGNGAGKTNLLEAIDYAATGASFRAASDEHLVALGADEGVVRAGFSVGERKVTVEAAIRTVGRNELLMNGKRLRRRGELTTTLATVVFLPDDLELIKGGPARRRGFLDALALRMYPAAGAEQRSFVRALRQRNGLLRRGGAIDTRVLDVWDERLAAAGAAVVARRLRSLEMLGPRVEAAYRAIAGTSSDTSWEYRSGWASGDENMEVLRTQLRLVLGDGRRVDLDRRITTRGPQRDDPVFLVAGRDARTLASQGEQRSLALSLRVASHSL
ncbi:MAG: DNA replication/repair protein RecF, partial [Dehalococcoidia bacterium]